MLGTNVFSRAGALTEGLIHDAHAGPSGQMSRLGRQGAGWGQQGRLGATKWSAGGPKETGWMQQKGRLGAAEERACGSKGADVAADETRAKEGVRRVTQLRG